MPFSRSSRRSALALVAAASVVSLTLPADASSTTGKPATGVATSTLALVQLDLSGTTVAAGELAAVAGNTTKPHLARLLITPIDSSVTGPVGQQTVTPGAGAAKVPATPKSVTLPSGLGQVTGPTFSAKAADNATGVLASAALKALGSVTLATVPLDLSTASLSDVAQVTKTGAAAVKTLTLGHLALPSVQALLASLGVDLYALTQQLTQGKLTQLADLLGGDVSALNAAVDSAQAAVGIGAAQSLTTAQTALATAQSALTTAQSAYDAPWAAISGLLAGVPGAPTSEPTAAAFLALPSGVQAAIEALSVPAASLGTLAQAVVDAQTQVSDANALVDALQALVDAVVAVVQGSDDPLAELGSVTVTTSAVAKRATAKATAAVRIGSVHVLGGLVPLGSLTSALGAVTGPLASVLESVAGVSFTAPTIAVGSPSEQTHRQGRTRSATASITALTVTLPSVTLPSSLAVPGVPTGVSGSLTFGQLAETAQFTPAVAAATTSGGTPGQPTGGRGSLPFTGGRTMLPVLGLLLLVAAIQVRRWTSRPA